MGAPSRVGDTEIPGLCAEKAILEVSPDDDSIPDGGLVAWLQVLASFLIFFNTWGVANAFGVFQTYYQSHVLASEGASKISWIGSIQGFLLMLSGVVTGPIFDRGYYRYLLGVGLVLSVLGVMMTSISTEYWQVILAQAVCLGIGSGCLFVPCLAITSTYFSEKRALALGIASCGSSIGAVIYPILFHRLQDKIGFGATTRAIGYIMLGTLAIAVALLRTRVPPTVQSSYFAVGALREPPFALFSLAMLLGFTGLLIPFYYISSYGTDKAGMSSDLAFYLIPIMNAGGVLGRLLPNYLADHAGPLNIMISFTSVCFLLAFVWPAIHSPAGTIAFAVLYGIGSGSYVGLPAAAVASITPDLRHVGTRIGTCFVFGAIGILVGTPIAGALVRLSTKSYWEAQVFCGAVVLAAVGALVAARIARSGAALFVKA